jgi:rhodanese-related sulfurtransferase
MKNKTAKTSLVLLLIMVSLMAFAQNINENIAKTPQINPKELKDKMDSKQEFILIDLRTEREHDAGYISGSTWIPRGFLEYKIQDVYKNPETEIVVYCGRGGRSILAVKSLQKLGYKNVFSIEGGMHAWVAKEYSLYNLHGEIKVVNFEKKDPNLSSYGIF